MVPTPSLRADPAPTTTGWDFHPGRGGRAVNPAFGGSRGSGEVHPSGVTAGANAAALGQMQEYATRFENLQGLREAAAPPEPAETEANIGGRGRAAGRAGAPGFGRAVTTAAAAAAPGRTGVRTAGAAGNDRAGGGWYGFSAGAGGNGCSGRADCAGATVLAFQAASNTVSTASAWPPAAPTYTGTQPSCAGGTSEVGCYQAAGAAEAELARQIAELAETWGGWMSIARYREREHTRLTASMSPYRDWSSFDGTLEPVNENSYVSAEAARILFPRTSPVCVAPGSGRIALRGPMFSARTTGGPSGAAPVWDRTGTATPPATRPALPAGTPESTSMPGRGLGTRVDGMYNPGRDEAPWYGGRDDGSRPWEPVKRPDLLTDPSTGRRSAGVIGADGRQVTRAPSEQEGAETMPDHFVFGYMGQAHDEPGGTVRAGSHFETHRNRSDQLPNWRPQGSMDRWLDLTCPTSGEMTVYEGAIARVNANGCVEAGHFREDGRTSCTPCAADTHECRTCEYRARTCRRGEVIDSSVTPPLECGDVQVTRVVNGAKQSSWEPGSARAGWFDVCDASGNRVTDGTGERIWFEPFATDGAMTEAQRGAADTAASGNLGGQLRDETSGFDTNAHTMGEEQRQAAYLITKEALTIRLWGPGATGRGRDEDGDLLMGWPNLEPGMTNRWNFAAQDAGKAIRRIDARQQIYGLPPGQCTGGHDCSATPGVADQIWIRTDGPLNFKAAGRISVSAGEPAENTGGCMEWHFDSQGGLPFTKVLAADGTKRVSWCAMPTASQSKMPRGACITHPDIRVDPFAAVR